MSNFCLQTCCMFRLFSYRIRLYAGLSGQISGANFNIHYTNMHYITMRHQGNIYSRHFTFSSVFNNRILLYLYLSIYSLAFTFSSIFLLGILYLPRYSVLGFYFYLRIPSQHFTSTSVFIYGILATVYRCIFTLTQFCGSGRILVCFGGSDSGFIKPNSIMYYPEVFSIF